MFLEESKVAVSFRASFNDKAGPEAAVAVNSAHDAVVKSASGASTFKPVNVLSSLGRAPA